MNTLRWLAAILAVLVLPLTIGPVSAQAQQDLGMLYEQGLEDLQNNLDAEAADKLRKGLEAAQSGGSPLADSDKAVQETRYALGYALARQGRYFDAIPVLDALVASAADNINARYLLGVTLIRSNSSENILRGMEVLKQMAVELGGGAEALAATASARLSYNLSSAEYAAGDAKLAMSMMADLFAKHGNSPGRDSEENGHLQFAGGVYLAATGDLTGARSTLDGLAGENSGYALQNGTTLHHVRSNVHYQAALDQLGKGGSSGGSAALEAIGTVEQIEGPTTSSMHTKALAYGLIGDSSSMNSELDKIKSSDSAYYERISK